MEPEYTFEDLPIAAVSCASHAAAEKSDMGALHIGSHVLLKLLNEGFVTLSSGWRNLNETDVS